MTAARKTISSFGPRRRPDQADSRSRREREQALGATLLRLGKLNEEALGKISELQERTNAPFTRAASKLGLLNAEDFAMAIGVQNGFIREHAGDGRLPPNAIIFRKPASREAEQFRALRTRLLTSRDAEKLNLFAMASNGSAREADHVAINLAASFAQVGKRVLIVDADLRSSRLAKLFAVAPGPGLRETLAGECDIRDAIRATIVANLSILTSGVCTSSAHELLSAKTLGLTFDYLRCAYDIVIIMTAPFGPVADAQFAWASAAAVFAVTRRNEDRLADLKALHSTLRQIDASIIGAALAG
jgi:capsular exopolysaccharide synthesis family protein